MTGTHFTAVAGKFISLAGFMLVIISIVSCGRAVGRNPSQDVAGGDPVRGLQLLQEYGCGACHTIQVVKDARATVGPPLDDWADRHYIAGNLPNTPENLIVWIQYPQSIEPGTAMPDLGMSENEARDIAAFLFTLRRSPNNFFGMNDNR